MKKTILCFLFGVLSTVSFAKGNSPNNCEKLSLTITNETGKTCKLINHNLSHGFFTYTSNVPSFIPNNTTTTPLFMTQSGMYGPELQLTYDCQNGRMISFTSKQNYCMMSSGAINGIIQFQNGINAEYSAKTGDYFWSQSGNIDWRLY
jgi:hypothetical protein